MKYGLTETTIEKIRSVFTRFPEIDKAVLYGSRAKGNYKSGSDIDLTLYGSALTSDLFSTITSVLDDLLLPYTIDLSLFEEISHAKLREHIERVGVSIYERTDRVGTRRPDWQTKPFEECIEKVTRTPKVQRKDFLDDGAYPIISQEDAFINGYWNNEADLFRITTPVVVFGDHTKILKYIDFNFVLGADGVKVLQPQHFLLPKFFYYQLRAVNLDSLGYARHYKLLKELEIVYPARAEQQRIIDILDEAHENIAALIAAAERNLYNARDLFESKLQAVFSRRGDDWGSCSLADACVVFADGDWVESKDQSPEGIRLIQTGNIGKGIFKERGNNARYISEATFRRLRCTEIFAGDCLISRLPDPVGRSCLLPDTGARTITAVDCTIVRFDERRVMPAFFVYYSQSRDYLSSVDYATTGTTRNRISRNNLGQIVIPVAPLVEQARIIAELDAIAAETHMLESVYARKVVVLDTLWKLLLRLAFTGAI